MGAPRGLDIVFETLHSEGFSEAAGLATLYFAQSFACLLLCLLILVWTTHLGITLAKKWAMIAIGLVSALASALRGLERLSPVCDITSPDVYFSAGAICAQLALVPALGLMLRLFRRVVPRVRGVPDAPVTHHQVEAEIAVGLICIFGACAAPSCAPKWCLAC